MFRTVRSVCFIQYNRIFPDLAWKRFIFDSIHNHVHITAKTILRIENKARILQQPPYLTFINEKIQVTLTIGFSPCAGAKQTKAADAVFLRYGNGLLLSSIEYITGACLLHVFGRSGKTSSPLSFEGRAFFNESCVLSVALSSASSSVSFVSL